MDNWDGCSVMTPLAGSSLALLHISSAAALNALGMFLKVGSHLLRLIIDLDPMTLW